ncbi:MAG: DNA polymerase III subunit beta, partial [Propionibacteriaceae bacterium]|nr:DNA polymerase III subunit beta [Propionibacteriaceae bacterium]
STGDQAKAVEVLEAVVTDSAGSGLTINAAGFNTHYLADALNVIDAPYVNFAFTVPGKPCLLTGVGDIDGDADPSYRHVIMLMRLPA